MPVKQTERRYLEVKQKILEQGFAFVDIDNLTEDKYGRVVEAYYIQTFINRWARSLKLTVRSQVDKTAKKIYFQKIG